jgi:hypothetical protein
LSTKNQSNQKRKQSYQQGQQNRTGQTQTQAQPQQAKPKPAPANAQAMAAQDAARKEARLQRQAEARALAEKRKQQAKLRKFGIIGAVGLLVAVLIGWLVLREVNKPGEGVAIMLDRLHIPAGTTSSVAYSTEPPTSGPHVDDLPQFKVYTVPITKELAVHGLEDGAVIINYRPDLSKDELDKLGAIATAYIGTPGKNRIIMYPYPNLSNPIALTTWGRIDRLDILDEARIRRFIDAYVNIDHHEGRDGIVLP